MLENKAEDIFPNDTNNIKKVPKLEFQLNELNILIRVDSERKELKKTFWEENKKT